MQKPFQIYYAVSQNVLMFIMPTSLCNVDNNFWHANKGSLQARIEVWINWLCPKALLLKLILNLQESRCTEKIDIAPQHRSLQNESIQTIIFFQPGLSLHPFYKQQSCHLPEKCFHLKISSIFWLFCRVFSDKQEHICMSGLKIFLKWVSWDCFNSRC
jgi:hypothetical protein